MFRRVTSNATTMPAKAQRMTLRRRVRPLRRAAVYGMVVMLIWIARSLPRRLGLMLFGFAGVLSYLLHADSRRKTLSNISHVFDGEYSGRRKWLLGMRTFRNLGRNVFDALRIPYTRTEKLLGLVTIDGEEILRRGMSEGKGVIVPTGHIGNWELLAAYLAVKGYPVSVVAKSLKDPRLNQLLLRSRESVGIQNIDRSSGGHKVLRALREGRILGILMDQDTSVKGMFTDFLGKNAFTPTGPAELAVRTAAPLIPIRLVMTSDKRYNINVGQPLEAPGDIGEDKSIEMLTRLCNVYLENQIRKYPAQWVWMHERWKSAAE